MNATIAIIKQAARIAFLLLLGPVVLWADSTLPNAKPADPIAEALPILQAKYPDFKELQYKEGDHLSDLIARSHGEISLGSPEVNGAPMVTALLPENVIYWRLSSFLPKTTWADLATQLEPATAGAVDGAILDLRGNAGNESIASAAEILDLFKPSDHALSGFCSPVPPAGNVISNTLSDHSFHAPIIVLINDQTAGSAEVLVACLKADGALVMGRETSGRGASLEEQKLASGQIMRYVASHIRTADGVDLWNHPVVPDITLKIDDANEKSVLARIDRGGVMEVIAEAAQRHRMSEAALVHGDDPELDDYVTAQEKKPDASAKPAIQDVVLISALDSLKAIELSQRTSRAAPVAGNGGTPSNASASLQ